MRKVPECHVTFHPITTRRRFHRLPVYSVRRPRGMTGDNRAVCGGGAVGDEGSEGRWDSEKGPILR